MGAAAGLRDTGRRKAARAASGSFPGSRGPHPRSPPSPRGRRHSALRSRRCAQGAPGGNSRRAGQAEGWGPRRRFPEVSPEAVCKRSVIAWEGWARWRRAGGGHCVKAAVKERSEFQKLKIASFRFSPPWGDLPFSPRLLVFCIPLLANIQHTLLSLSAPGSLFPTAHSCALKAERCLTQHHPKPSAGPGLWQAPRTTERMNEINQPGSGKVTPMCVQTGLYFCFWTSPKFIQDGWVFINV